MQLVPIDENGFWAFVDSGSDKDKYEIGGYVTMARIGPFDFMRLDYTLASIRQGLRRPYAARGGLDVNKILTILYPHDELPVIVLATKEEVYGNGNPM